MLYCIADIGEIEEDLPDEGAAKDDDKYVDEVIIVFRFGVQCREDGVKLCMGCLGNRSCTLL